MATITPMPARLTVQGRQTDAETREEAFRLWVSYGRAAKKVAERIGCSESTIHKWRVDEGWEQRRQLEAQAFLPGATVEGAIALRLAAHNAAVRLQQITYDNLEHGTPIDDKEVKALTSIAHIGGYAPGTNRSPVDEIMQRSKPDDPNQPASTIELAGKSPEELAILEATYRKRKL